MHGNIHVNMMQVHRNAYGNMRGLGRMRGNKPARHIGMATCTTTCMARGIVVATLMHTCVAIGVDMVTGMATYMDTDVVT